MDAFRTGLMRIADNNYLNFQHATKMFGFLEDGRDLVDISHGEVRPVATFRDHSDEGWPEVRVGLPVDARFVSAASGTLTRVAKWKLRGPESEILEELSSHPDVPAFESRAKGGVVAKLGFNATFAVKGLTAEWSGLMLKQVREPEAIRTALKNRATR